MIFTDRNGVDYDVFNLGQGDTFGISDLLFIEVSTILSQNTHTPCVQAYVNNYLSCRALNTLVELKRQNTQSPLNVW